ncbi:MAG TPA: diguanylate cyclase [Comamonas sp.]
MTYRLFSRRVTWLALIVSLGIGALFAHSMWSMRQEHWSAQLRTNGNLSSTFAKGLEWSLEAVDLSLQHTAIALNEANVLEAEPDQLSNHSVLEALWRDIEANNLLVLDSQGRALSRTEGVQRLGKSFANHDFFQAFFLDQYPGVFIGAPTQDLYPGEYVLPIARAVRGKFGLLSGVVVGVLHMHSINAWLASMDLGENSGVNVIREDGLILTRFPYQPSAIHNSLAGSSNLARFVASPQGNFVGIAVIDGVQRLYTHNRVGHFPVVVNVAQATRTIFQAWRRNVWQLGAFASLLMLGCFGLSVLFARELSRREATEVDLFAEKERMRLTLQAIGDAVVCTDAKGNITYLNPVARQITGIEMWEVENHPVEVLQAMPYAMKQGPDSSPLRRVLQQGKAVDRERTTLMHRGSGELLEMEESASLVKAFDGTVLGAVAVLRDVTSSVAHEEHMKRLAFHDTLTGLPNRQLLQDRAQQAMAHSKRSGDIMAVLYLDLDGFKQINDTHGHQAGDAALIHAAKALQSSVRESDTVCRLGGDEFVLLLCEIPSRAHLQTIARKVLKACGQPFMWQDKAYVLHISGGMALYPEHATQWGALLHCADTAMYVAKQAGKRQIRLFHDGAEASLLAKAESAAGFDMAAVGAGAR